MVYIYVVHTDWYEMFLHVWMHVCLDRKVANVFLSEMNVGAGMAGWRNERAPWPGRWVGVEYNGEGLTVSSGPFKLRPAICVTGFLSPFAATKRRQRDDQSTRLQSASRLHAKVYPYGKSIIQHH